MASDTNGPGGGKGGIGIAPYSLDEMTRGGLLGPVIIAGIPNAGGDRVHEYAGYITGQAARQQGYEDYVVNDVLPAVCNTLGCDPGRSRTVVGGVSYGADSALSLALRHPQRFGGALVLSGFRKFGPGANAVQPLASHLSTIALANRPKIMVGTGEADAHERDHRGEFDYLRRVLGQAGYTEAWHPQGFNKGVSPSANLHLFVDPPGQHNERSWRAQMRLWALPLVAPPEPVSP